MRKLILIVPALLLATGCSMLFKPRDNSSMGNTTFGNLSTGNMAAPMPPMGNMSGNGDLTADQGGNADSAPLPPGKPGADGSDMGGDQGQQPQDQGGDQGGDPPVDQGNPGK